MVEAYPEPLFNPRQNISGEAIIWVILAVGVSRLPLYWRAWAEWPGPGTGTFKLRVWPVTHHAQVCIPTRWVRTPRPLLIVEAADLTASGLGPGPPRIVCLGPRCRVSGRELSAHPLGAYGHSSIECVSTTR